jgi:hypothetical protein
MIPKSVQRFSEKIMLKRRSEAPGNIRPDAEERQDSQRGPSSRQQQLF